ncbi:MAG: hypothetical protein RRY21_04120, partial [Oscillospiraceae bacterium]
MTSNPYKQQIALPTEGRAPFSNFAFDGCHYYLLIPCECGVGKYDSDFEKIDCLETCRNYDCLCYDGKRHCFWAATREKPSCVFQLDRCLREIDSLRFCPPAGSGGSITGLSFDCCRDRLLAACAGSVLSLDPDTQGVTLLYHACNAWIGGILSLCPGYFVTLIRGGRQTTLLFDGDNRLMGEQASPPGHLLANLLYNPCREPCGLPALCALVSKRGCYSYICKRLLSYGELGFEPCPCNDTLCDCCNAPPHHPGCDAKCDVMQSIALVETALSHILNAEGEKLQKVLATTDDLDRILCVNREVTQTIVHATNLEHTLYAKLTALDGMACCPPY